ncbi:MAG TPA: hypothetical protein VGQ41_11580 [Pyrinomonadaceae bacterium]|jgi:hypothetical protein|nr:hypothetical protein [Pyrinomonadaceae bacterium]
MKPVKNLIFAALLVFSIALNSFAGDVEVPGAPAPTPPKSTAVLDPNTSSTDTTEETNVALETSDSLFYEALIALLSVY